MSVLFGDMKFFVCYQNASCLLFSWWTETKKRYKSTRLKTCAKGSITWYGVTPRVYWSNKSDYKGNMSLGRILLGRKWNFTAGSTHIVVNSVTLIQAGFEKVLVIVNVDGLEHATGHCKNEFFCRRSYQTTISQKVTYVLKVLTEDIFCLPRSP